MKLEDITLGMRVVPMGKTTGLTEKATLENSAVYARAKADNQAWLYVVGFPKEREPGEIVLHHIQSNEMGDFFMAADVELYKCKHQ